MDSMVLECALVCCYSEKVSEKVRGGYSFDLNLIMGSKISNLILECISVVIT